ncbi:MAG: cupin domain-containing protein [Ignavibacteria bacterium]|nr:cupin domain-containing protein [Ignavibacteria bacterium]
MSGKSLLLEKIVSKGYRTPQKKWLTSGKDEWVILLKGKAGIMFENGVELELREGDYVSIPGNTKHKVTYTSKRPECIWLALHYKNI